MKLENSIIIGSPGSGKTWELTNIYSQLLNDSNSTDNLVALSFTRSVADAMAVRISEKTGESYTTLRRGYVSTFHGFCRRLLSQYFEIKVMPPKEIAWNFLKYIRETKNFSETQYEKQILQLFITLFEFHEEKKIKQNLWLYIYNQIQILPEDIQWTEEEARKLYQQIEFNETYPIYRTYRLLQTPMKLTFYELQLILDKNIDKFKDKFKCILVDEYQDIDKLQWDIIQKFNATKILIGDLDQSIYGSFRNTCAAMFLSLPYKKRVMPFTYRYDTDYAQRLERGIAKFITDRHKKDIKGVGSKISINYYFPDIIEEGVVLARTNNMLQELSYSLISKYIPHIIEKSSLLGFDTANPFLKKFKHILIFLKSGDSEELFAKNIAKIIRYKHYNDIPISDKIEILKEKYSNYYNFFIQLKHRSIEDKIRLCQYHEKLKSQAKELIKIKNVEQFLVDIVNPRVTLSTVHRFKGREHKNIYIYGFKDGLFPLSKGEYQEEVKIAYVALSRTKKNLYLDGDSEFEEMLW